MKKTLLLLMFLACITLVNAKDFPCAATFDYQQPILHITNKTLVNISIRQGDKPQILIYAPEALAKDVVLDFQAGRLFLSVHNDTFGKFKDAKVVIVTPKLSTIKNNGCGNCTVTDFNGRSVEITSRGSGDFRIRRCDFEHLAINSKSSAAYNIDEIKVNDMNIHSYGSGKMAMANCNVDDLSVLSYGTGHFRMHSLHVGKMKIEAKKRSVFQILDIRAQLVSISSFGESTFFLSGTTKVFSPVIKGGGKINHKQLKIN